MPPLKNALSRRWSRNAGGLLTRVGHDRLIVIGDTSLDVPDGAEVFYYLGNPEGDLTGAAALRELADACPLEGRTPARYMTQDAWETRTHAAPLRNHRVIEELGLIPLGLDRNGPDGLYAVMRGTDPAKAPIFCLTASELAYDCIVVAVGASQL